MEWGGYHTTTLNILCELIPSLNYKASEVLRTSVCSVSIWLSQPRKVAGVREREKKEKRERDEDDGEEENKLRKSQLTNRYSQ